MSNTELKVIRAAIRSTRDLIQTLNDGREMPSQLAKIFFELNDDAIILSGMIEDGIANPIFSVHMTKERRRIQWQILEALKAADYDRARLYIHILGIYDESNLATSGLK